MKKHTIVIILITIILYSCTTEDNNLSRNERALLSISEFQNYQDKDSPPFLTSNIEINFDSVRNYSMLDSFTKKLCNENKNLEIDRCWELINLRYNLDKFTFDKCTKSEQTILIPLIGFSCDSCIVEPSPSNTYYFNLNKQNKFEFKQFHHSNDTVEYIDPSKIEKKLNTIYLDELTQYFANPDFPRQIQEKEKSKIRRNFDLLILEVSIDTNLSFKKLERFYSSAIKIYLKNMNILTEKYLGRSLKDLNENELCVLGKNINFNLRLTRPIEKVRFIAPEILDSKTR